MREATKEKLLFVAIVAMALWFMFAIAVAIRAGTRESQPQEIRIVYPTPEPQITCWQRTITSKNDGMTQLERETPC